MVLMAPLVAKEKEHSETLVHKLIQEIKRAPASEKRVKMNELKILLRSMNQKTRNEAMRNLQKSFAKHKVLKNTNAKSNVMKQHIKQNQLLRDMQNVQQRQHQGARK